MAEEIKASRIEVKPSPEGGKPKDDAKDQHPVTVTLPASINANITGNLEVKSETHQTNEHEHWYSNPDFYVATFTGFLVFVTGVLAFFTLKLWRSTRKLVRGADKTSRKELRAYVALEAIYPRDPRMPLSEHSLKVRVRNFGSTPAHHMTIWFKFIEEIPPEIGFDPIYSANDKVSEPQMLNPRQEFNRVVTKNFVFFGELNKARGDDMGENYVYGRVIYKDIFDDWWGTCFCFEYEGGALFRHHGDYNKEESYGKTRPF